MAKHYADGQFADSGFSERVEQIAQICHQIWGEPQGWDYTDQDAALRVADRIERFGPFVPELMVRLWSLFGFAGFHDRSIWLCDPALPMATVLDALEGDPHPDPEKRITPPDPAWNQGWIPLLRDQYGTIIAYSSITDEYLLADTTSGHAYTFDRPGSVDTDPDSTLYNALILGPRTWGYFRDPVPEIDHIYGPLSTDTFYNALGNLLANHLTNDTPDTDTSPDTDLAAGTELEYITVSPLETALPILAGLHAYIRHYSHTHAIDEDIDLSDNHPEPLPPEHTRYNTTRYPRQPHTDYLEQFPIYLETRFGISTATT